MAYTVENEQEKSNLTQQASNDLFGKMTNKSKAKSEKSVDMKYLEELDKKYQQIEQELKDHYDQDWDEIVYEAPNGMIPNHHCWEKDPVQCNREFGKLKPAPYKDIVRNAPIQKECKAFDIGVLSESFDDETIATNSGSLNSMDGNRVYVHYEAPAAPFLCCIPGDL